MVDVCGKPEKRSQVSLLWFWQTVRAHSIRQRCAADHERLVCALDTTLLLSKSSSFGENISELTVFNRSVFINTALTLWSFHLSVDESKPADDMAFIKGSMRDQAPIGLHFKPRIAQEKLMAMMEQ